ncbi:unnamed protein product [Miscanthus lutarioriparius]|uniref:Uncharacterized protein n=1 Tax=Miscanthus lutarioriparius TaxID=422564 RepID=A0A811MBY3_9POAL|nr:unnamed protein product [Miscanthus lutarioriparius]
MARGARLLLVLALLAALLAVVLQLYRLRKPGCITGICFWKFYRFAGKLIGRYYDSQGNPTKYLKGVEMKAKRGAQLLEKQKSDEAKIPGCNSKWSQQEGGEVWCDTGYPRLVRRPGDIALTGQVSQRNAER